MLSNTRRTFAGLLCAALLLGVTATASASHGQITFFEIPSELLSARTREPAIAKLQRLGARALRVELYWAAVAPSPKGTRAPAGDPADPAYYNWSAYDPILLMAQQLHWKVLLTVTSPVPRWATATHRDSVTRPSDRAFQQFMTAVGRRYGSLVSMFSIWNEPNHPAFLRPQFTSRGTPASPRIYRGLFEAGYLGLQQAGISHPKVLMGETAPGGEVKINPHKGLLKDVAPLAFLREALCLDSHYRRAGACSPLPAYGYGHHAYTNAAGPTYIPAGRDNVTIGVLSRLTSALDRAAATHAIRAHMPIYLTEFGVNSKPNKYLGVLVAQQAEYDAIAERIAYNNPRVASFSQYLLKDDPLSGSLLTGGVGFQTGLEYVSGAPKPLYAGFPVPLVVSKRGSRFSLWGLVRPATGPTSVTVEVQPGHSSHFRVLKKLATNAGGYWTFSSATRGQHWRVRWTSPAGIRYLGPPIRAY